MGARLDKAKKLIRRIPLAGPAIECSPGEHWFSAMELIAGLFWSMLPIWVGTYVAILRGQAFDWSTIRAAFGTTLAGGELFIYAAAFLAPVYFILYKEMPGGGRFPSKLSHSILTTMITVFAAVSFAQQRSDSTINPKALHTFAVLSFWVALALIYLATLYHNHVLPSRLPEEIRGQAADFLSEYQERRG
jgi:hypothetical protein